MGQTDASHLLRSARRASGLSQRELASRASTAQSVVARIEAGETAPTIETLQRLLRAAGFDLSAVLVARPTLDRQMLDDVPRILRLSPTERIEELANISRFITGARRV